jgi:hypothetical protein
MRVGRVANEEAFMRRGGDLRIINTRDVNASWASEGAQVGEVRVSSCEEPQTKVIDTTPKGEILDVNRSYYSKLPDDRAHASIVKHASRPF